MPSRCATAANSVIRASRWRDTLALAFTRTIVAIATMMTMTDTTPCGAGCNGETV